MVVLNPPDPDHQKMGGQGQYSGYGMKTGCAYGVCNYLMSTYYVLHPVLVTQHVSFPPQAK